MFGKKKPDIKSIKAGILATLPEWVDHPLSKIHKPAENVTEFFSSNFEPKSVLSGSEYMRAVLLPGGWTVQIMRKHFGASLSDGDIIDKSESHNSEVTSVDFLIENVTFMQAMAYVARYEASQELLGFKKNSDTEHTAHFRTVARASRVVFNREGLPHAWNHTIIGNGVFDEQQILFTTFWQTEDRVKKEQENIQRETDARLKKEEEAEAARLAAEKAQRESDEAKAAKAARRKAEDEYREQLLKGMFSFSLTDAFTFTAEGQGVEVAQRMADLLIARKILSNETQRLNTALYSFAEKFGEEPHIHEIVKYLGGDDQFKMAESLDTKDIKAGVTALLVSLRAVEVSAYLTSGGDEGYKAKLNGFLRHVDEAAHLDPEAALRIRGSVASLAHTRSKHDFISLILANMAEGINRYNLVCHQIAFLDHKLRGQEYTKPLPEILNIESILKNGCRTLSEEIEKTPEKIRGLTQSQARQDPGTWEWRNFRDKINEQEDALKTKEKQKKTFTQLLDGLPAATAKPGVSVTPPVPAVS